MDSQENLKLLSKDALGLEPRLVLIGFTFTELSVKVNMGDNSQWLRKQCLS